MPRSNERLVGYIGVDAGLCWLGDPCYILHREDGLPETLGKNWGEFVDLMYQAGGNGNYHSFPYALGHEGLGVAVSTGYGDGSYPVYATINEEGRVASVRVCFINDEKDEC